MDIKKLIEKLFKDVDGKKTLSEEFKTQLADAFKVAVANKDTQIKTLTEQITKLTASNGKLKKDIPTKVKKLVKEHQDFLVEKLSSFMERKAKELVDEKTAKALAEAEIYGPLVKGVKELFESKGMKLGSKAHGVLKEAKGEILKLEKDVNSITSKYEKMKSLTKKLMVQEYLEEKCKGLTREQTDKVVKVLGEAKSTKEIDNRFKSVREVVLGEETKVNDKKVKKTKVQNLNINENKDDNSLGQDLL